MQQLLELSIGRELAANPQPDGAMVAWYPPLSDREETAREEPWAEDPTNMHCTLVFLGKVADLSDTDKAIILETVAATVDQFTSFEVKDSGTALFQQGEEGLCLVALLDSGILELLQEELTNALFAEGVAGPNDHGFTAHMTIGYLPPGEQPTIDMLVRPNRQLNCGAVTVCLGPDQTVFPLGAVVAAGDLPGHAFHGNQWTGGGGAAAEKLETEGRPGPYRTMIYHLMDSKREFYQDRLDELPRHEQVMLKQLSNDLSTWDVASPQARLDAKHSDAEWYKRLSDFIASAPTNRDTLYRGIKGTTTEHVISNWTRDQNTAAEYGDQLLTAPPGTLRAVDIHMLDPYDPPIDSWIAEAK